ncbi:NlpC/P60 family [Serratia marcescens]|uniref:NlpC/P60 family protein n=1 Tax=Serratia marcescens TaxID=615 RepID=UPI00217AE64B|nr:NlpC/P60 family protein [Serratia marcescens]CAI1945093.1 NlpC/P60 family [Serratia marcescens]
MHKSDFIHAMEGKPWRDRAGSFDTADCWGLVVLYYRHVLGIEIHQTPDYEAGSDFLTCFSGDVVFWHQAEKAADGSIFIAYYGGQPAHVGLVIDGQAFHSRGEAGHVRFDKLRTLERVFTKLEFYDYAVDRSTARARVAERTA